VVVAGAVRGGRRIWVMEIRDLLIPLFVAIGGAALATPLVARTARALAIVDQPTERGVSTRTGMPLAGGLAVAVGFAAGFAAALQAVDATVSRASLDGLVIGATIMVVSGICDDRWGMKAWSKFSVQIVAASVAIAHGYEISHFTEPLTSTTFFLPRWLVWVVSVLWIVGITNAVNLVDGLDGLASGVGAIIGATLAVIAWQTGQPLGVCMGVALVGSLLGFLPYNFWPARIFLGDTGSLFIGYVLALMALDGYRQLTLITFVVPLLALAVPIIDTFLSIVRRIRKRAPIFLADRLHMHHRLLASEGSHRRAVLQFYMLTAAFCLIALSFTQLEGMTAAIFLAAVIALTIRMLWNLDALSLEADESAAGELPAGAKKEER
jgi:UDP-GlcNAc:undecaprenyl-phosphate GlcNAc-1-phosphate transferase